MDLDQAEKLIVRMKGLWPKMDLDGPQGEVWAKRLRKLPFTVTLAAIDSVFSTGKFAPKPVEIENRIRLLSESGKQPVEKKPETREAATARIVAQLQSDRAGALRVYGSKHADAQTKERATLEFRSLCSHMSRMDAYDVVYAALPGWDGWLAWMEETEEAYAAFDGLSRAEQVAMMQKAMASVEGGVKVPREKRKPFNQRLSEIRAGLDNVDAAPAASPLAAAMLGEAVGGVR
jgi:hypothetical protein